ncbi:MAG: HNH endonuclease [Tenericutes bacterium]|nr:HNH endonuclease [Mycoplasmatota bacterium]
MQKGVEFVIANTKRALELSKVEEPLKHLYGSIKREYDYIVHAKKTGDLYRHFLEFKSGKHKYADDFIIFNKYNLLTNEEISDYLFKTFPDEISDYTRVSDFIVGGTYTNAEIRFGFRCTYMGGIRPSNKTNTIVVIANHSKSLYEDKRKGNTLLYTGQGMLGDQQMKGKNLSLKNAKADGRSIHLFELYIDKEYIYRGEVVVDGEIQHGEQPDEKNVLRKVIVFPLKSIEESVSELEDLNLVRKQEEEKTKSISKLPSKKLFEKAKEAGETIRKEVKTTYIYRNQYVSESVKRRANGRCELCGKLAPFIKHDGEPYLEVHHVITLSNNGPDSLINTVALCPNCHRKVHYGFDDMDEKLLVKVIMRNLHNEQKLLDEARILFDVEEPKNLH